MTNGNRKGKVGEREAAKEIAKLFGVEARRGQQFNGGDGSPDIVTAIPGVHFEIKRCERQHIYDWMAQAASDAEQSSSIPVVLHRQNGKPWLAVVRLDDLPQLATQLFLTKAETA